MRNRAIEGALPITAKLLADDLGLQLHFQAQGFASSVDEDGVKHLSIPALPMDDRIAGALALGGIVHEDSHFNETNFADVPEKGTRLNVLWNVLEDVRCELAEIKRYPGARAVLSRMVGAMVENGQFKPISESEGVAGVQWYVLFRLRSDLLGQQALQSVASSAAEIVKPLLPGASFARLTAMMFDVVQCQSSADCVDLAQQILEMLKEEAENPQPPEQQPDQNPDQNPDQQPQQADASQTGGDSGQGDDPSQSADDQSSDGDSQGQSAPQSGSADAQGAAEGSAGEAAGQKAGDGTETSSKVSASAEPGGEKAKAQAVKEYLAGAGGEKSMDMGDMLATAMDQLSINMDAVRLPDAVPLDRELGRGEDVLARLRSETNAVRRRIQGLLEAKAMSTITNGRSGSRLDVKRLWRVRTGDARVFEKRIEGHKQDTAIQLLIDRSTSMRRDIQVACDAALAVALAMDGVQGVTTSVAAFPHVGDGKEDDVLLVSEFSESFRKVAARFPAVGVQGCTPMAQAMLWGGYHLHSSGKARKIMVVVTDGKPDADGPARQVIAKLAQSGVEVMGLGIKIEVAGLFPTAARIDSVQELARAVFGMLQEKLAKAA